jgi:hypothetical protein
VPFRCALGAYTHNEEPSLDELLAEPIVQLVMKRDGLTEDEVRAIVDVRRRTARKRPEERSAPDKVNTAEGDDARRGPLRA